MNNYITEHITNNVNYKKYKDLRNIKQFTAYVLDLINKDQKEGYKVYRAILKIEKDLGVKLINEINDWCVKNTTTSYIHAFKDRKYSHRYIACLAQYYPKCKKWIMIDSTIESYKTEQEALNFMRSKYPNCPTKEDIIKKCGINFFRSVHGDKITINDLTPKYKQLVLKSENKPI